jgi:CubicO group peptidase (beta-lactamase class C family)
MKSTRSTENKSLVSNRASGYVWKDGAFQNQPVLWPFVAFSAGSILSTVEDMALWDLALYSEKLVKRSSLEQMWRPALSKDGEPFPYNYGFGWFTDLYHGHRIVQHSGGTPGFSSTFFRFPGDSFSVIILTNHADIVIDHLAIDLAGIYIPGLRRPMEIKDPIPVNTERRKNIFTRLLQGKFDSVEFTPAMNVFLKTSTGKSLFQWFASLGKPGSFRLSDMEKRKGFTVFRYRVELGNNTYLFTISEMDNGKIAQIYFS